MRHLRRFVRIDAIDLSRFPFRKAGVAVTAASRVIGVMTAGVRGRRIPAAPRLRPVKSEVSPDPAMLVPVRTVLKKAPINTILTVLGNEDSRAAYGWNPERKLVEAATRHPPGSSWSSFYVALHSLHPRLGANKLIAVEGIARSRLTGACL